MRCSVRGASRGRSFSRCAHTLHAQLYRGAVHRVEWHPLTDHVVWENDRYLFRETYEIDASAEDFFDRENQAIAEASLRFAETMVADLIEGF